MNTHPFPFIAHGGDYNPDQWIDTPEIWDEDIRLMRLAHVNCVTVGIFSWSLLEPEEGVYSFAWLDTVLDKLHAAGISAVLATPSGARPAWLAQKYPEVLRTPESGIPNEYGVRHNHCLTSPIYREKVRNINARLAERYKDHPAVKLWHVSNEYGGECHCPRCQAAFRDWLKNYYHGDLEALNRSWWNNFWSHRLTDWSQINSPKDRGENHSSAMKLCWSRFVTDTTISFYQNEIEPLRRITPHIPITTNLMRTLDGLDYQTFAKHLDIVSWDSYPAWGEGDDVDEAANVAFYHDAFRSMKGGKPFLLMESTPSIVNWHSVNKLPHPGRHQLGALQAVAHGADSIFYFQWRKARGGHEKYHGAVVDHCGHENTRVFRNVTQTGTLLQQLAPIAGITIKNRVAIICDWQNAKAVKFYCGYNNLRRDYVAECVKWYKPFWQRGIGVDVIAMDDDLSGYDLVIAPYLYMLKDGTEAAIARYVAAGGTFVGTYLTGIVDKDDLCHLGGFPAGELKEVFGVWAEETDALPAGVTNRVEFADKSYTVEHICDLLQPTTASVLGRYQQDFYAGTTALTVNTYGKGKAYYAAFRNDGDFADDLCARLAGECGLSPAVGITPPAGVELAVRGGSVFLLNYTDADRSIVLDAPYTNADDGCLLQGTVTLPAGGYLVLRP